MSRLEQTLKRFEPLVKQSQPSISLDFQRQQFKSWQICITMHTIFASNVGLIFTVIRLSCRVQHAGELNLLDHDVTSQSSPASRKAHA